MTFKIKRFAGIIFRDAKCFSILDFLFICSYSAGVALAFDGSPLWILVGFVDGNAALFSHVHVVQSGQRDLSL